MFTHRFIIICEYLPCAKHSGHSGNGAEIAALVELMFWGEGKRQ